MGSGLSHESRGREGEDVKAGRKKRERAKHFKVKSWVGRVYNREERNARLEEFAWFELRARWRARGGEGGRRAGDALAWCDTPRFLKGEMEVATSRCS